MAQLLKQSTAYTFQLGPFVDSTDGVTPEAALTIAASDVDISKNGGAYADKNDSTALTGTGDSQGYYDCVLDATDTGTLGPLEVRSYVSGALPVVKSFQVVPAHVYDGLVAGTDNVQVDVVQVLGTTTTATLDSLSSQISSIGSGTGAALNYPVDADNASSPIKEQSSVGTQTGTFANTLADDGTTHQIASVGNAINWVYGFSCGAARAASKFVSRANMSATGDTVTVSAYNFSTLDWDTRTTITGTAETLRDVPLLAAHTGTSGADAGKVYIRFVFSEGDAGTLIIDEAYVQAQQSGSQVGYADGAIWVKAAGASGTVPYVNGTADNPCPWANAVTLAAAIGLTRFRILNDETVTLDATLDKKSLVGDHWYLVLGGQQVGDCYIKGASNVTGTATGTEHNSWEDCELGSGAAGLTVPPGSFLRCGFNTPTGQPFAGGSAGNFSFVDCFSLVAGSGTPYLTFTGASKVSIRRWSGGSNITLDSSSAELTMEVVTGGGQTIAVGGADIEIRGICRSISLTGITADTTAQISAVTGPISLAGADGTVNIYGVCGVVTDSRTGAPLTLNNKAVSQATLNAEMDTALADYDPPTKAELDNAVSPLATSVEIAALQNIGTGDVETAVGAALSTFDVPTYEDLYEAVGVVNVTRVNGIQVVGSGTELDPWGPVQGGGG